MGWFIFDGITYWATNRRGLDICCIPLFAREARVRRSAVYADTALYTDALFESTSAESTLVHLCTDKKSDLTHVIHRIFIKLLNIL